jgi:hypothetical protein
VASTSNADGLGIKGIYKTKPVGRQWFFNATEPRDGVVISPKTPLLSSKTGASEK